MNGAKTQIIINKIVLIIKAIYKIYMKCPINLMIAAIVSISEIFLQPFHAVESHMPDLILPRNSYRGGRTRRSIVQRGSERLRQLSKETASSVGQCQDFVPDS